MKLFPLLLVVVAFSGVSCERHEFDGPNGTRQLHEEDAAKPEHPAPEAHPESPAR